ncbi:MAG: dTDP-4-dehydrorhamnose reductase [Chthoniobacterales bacterium]|nr:dTDP-4-dehydrorhamnose reductase [Chthoniobacterales bacterium]
MAIELTEPPGQRPGTVAIIGAGGRLGKAILRKLGRTADVIGFTHEELNLADTEGLRKTLRALEFDLMINAAAQTNVDRCESDSTTAFAVNAQAPGVLAEICREKGARFIHISTDYVFDGEKREPYREEDEARPLSVYGESKLEGEQRVLAVNPDHLVARLSWVFGPDRPSFVDWIVEQARQHEQVEAIADKISTPTYTLDIATMLQPLLASSVGGGVWHLANHGGCSWREFGQHALDCCQAEGMALRARRVGAVSLRDMKSFIARRPIYTVLATEKYERLTGQVPRDWREAVADYVQTHIARGARLISASDGLDRPSGGGGGRLTENA